MADKPTPETNPERGWGQLLPRFFDEHVAIHNHAVNGRSTKSFIDEGKWGAVEHALKPGDYVFIQFGHNDEKVEDSARYAAPYTAYRKNLERFVAETRAKGATPVLFTPIVRRKFNAQGTLEDTHGAYPLVVREVARDLNVAFVDLQTLTEDLVRGAGPEGSKKLYVWVAPGESSMYPEGRSGRHASLRRSARRVSPNLPRRQSRTVVFRFANSCATSTPRRAEDAEIPLWPNGAPGALGSSPDDQPAITPVHRAEVRGATGAAMLVFPGGGYEHLAWEKEGTNVAQWLNTLGVSAFVVRYRLGPRYHHPTMLADARRAVRVVRARAARLGHRSLTNRRHGLFRGWTHGVDGGHPVDSRRQRERRRGRTHFVAPRSRDTRVSGHHDDRAVRAPRLTPQPHRRASRTINWCALRRASCTSPATPRRPSSSPPATTQPCRCGIH